MTSHMEINVSIGETINLNCPVTGNPLPSIAWRRGKNTTIFSTNQIFHRTILDEGSFTNYTCNATNQFGSKIFLLTVKNNKGIYIDSGPFFFSLFSFFIFSKWFTVTCNFKFPCETLDGVFRQIKY